MPRSTVAARTYAHPGQLPILLVMKTSDGLQPIEAARAFGHAPMCPLRRRRVRFRPELQHVPMCTFPGRAVTCGGRCTVPNASQTVIYALCTPFLRLMASYQRNFVEKDVSPMLTLC